MAKMFETNAQVEKEIQRLLQSEYVKLAKKEEYVRNRRRQYMYCLRTLERKGKELAEAGVTFDSLDSMLEDDSYED